MPIEITEKSKKSDILKAYEEAMKDLKAVKKSSLKEERQQQVKQETVKEAAKQPSDSIARHIMNLKLHAAQLLDELGGKIETELKKFETIQQAIGIEQQSLNEKYEINANADTLNALLLAQKQKNEQFEAEMRQKKEAFEREMAEKKQFWEKESLTLHLERKEKEQQLEKARKREEDEYSYKLKLERKRTQDQYEVEKLVLEKELEEKREAFEKEFKEREAVLAAKETELKALQEKVETFPTVLEEALEKAKIQAVEKLQMDCKYAADIREKEIEGERRLNKQIIAAHESKIKEMQGQIEQLTQKTNHANSQVQDIAIKAIESTAGIKQNFSDAISRQSIITGKSSKIRTEDD